MPSQYNNNESGRSNEFENLIIDMSVTKYLITAEIKIDGIVTRSDVIGAIFGQTEGLLDDLDLREAQRSGRIGRIEVKLEHRNGKTYGKIWIPSSLDQVETAIVAAAIEQIERVGPCRAEVKVLDIEDVRKKKKEMIVDRAVQLYYEMKNKLSSQGATIREIVIEKVKEYEIIEYGPDRCPAGPEVEGSDEIIIVEGRNDVLNLLKNGYKNAIAVNGTNVPPTIIKLSQEKTTTAFVDGDRGGLAILKELLQVADIDYIAVAPRGWEVEQLSYKQILKALRSRINVKQLMSNMSVTNRDDLMSMIIQKAIELMEKIVSEEFEEAKEKISSRVLGEGRTAHERPQFGETKSSNAAATSRAERLVETTPASRQEAPRSASQQNAVEIQATLQQKTFKPTVESLEAPPELSEYVKKISQMDYRELLEKRLAAIVDKSGNVIKTIAVRELMNELKTISNAQTLILGGIITQRLIDMAYERGIKEVIGLDMRGVVRLPHDMIIITRHNIGQRLT
ncbi:MAG: DNA primase [Euryarchaeota archaeon]|nr:DNA primase [Euryarchaeota archaeon]